MRLVAALILVAAPAAAQQTPLTFEAGKALPLANGQWSYVATAAESIATFGTQLQLRCDRSSRTVVISRLNSTPASLTIVADSTSRTLPLNGQVPANDPLLDAIAFSRGRFIVAGGTGPTIAVPSWPEPARSIEDCRN
ncbi:hypothetical protein LZ518_05900 [Sphingomonas sp. RB56-2]|uniref:Uncharacterized protein n=1 Tax=Sphingomonas brevis TaxID=2908206 RepID=A0ABT0S8D0_9SPHN|nr:hypothetical protein [Sphingomonas brevis]MCL6740666.1 hypothetical protein [Sphingomonas brevis]